MGTIVEKRGMLFALSAIVLRGKAVGILDGSRFRSRVPHDREAAKRGDPPMPAAGRGRGSPLAPRSEMIGGLHPGVQGRAHTREQLVKLDGRVLVRLAVGVVPAAWQLDDLPGCDLDAFEFRLAVYAADDLRYGIALPGETRAPGRVPR